MDPWSRETRERTRPLLLGMNNPYSDDPEFDLYPYPDGSAGHRLWKMLPEGPDGMVNRRQYLRAFDRRNLLHARKWDSRSAREAAAALLPELDGRLVVVLGSQVRAALGLPPAEPLVRQMFRSASNFGSTPVEFEWIAVPHPSGRNLWYNSEQNRRAVGEMLWGLMSAAVP